MFKTIVQNYLTPIVLLGLVCVIAYDHLAGRTPTVPVSIHDPVAVKLGTDYRIKMALIGGSGIKAVANGNFNTLDDLTKAQQGALDAALLAAYVPIANELQSRFGRAEDDTNKPSMATIQSFFKDMDYAYEGGK